MWGEITYPFPNFNGTMIRGCISWDVLYIHAGRIGLTDILKPLQWRHNERDGVSNHQPHDCLLDCSRRRSKKISKLRVTGLCEGNSPVTCEFPAQRASNAENFPFDDVIMVYIDGLVQESRNSSALAQLSGLNPLVSAYLSRFEEQ